MAVLSGGPGSDTLTGTDDADSIYGSAGDEGLSYWLERMSDGMSRADVADGFVRSAEAAPMQDTEAAVQSLFQGLLDRPAEAEGLAYWQGIAETQGLAAALLGISDSLEALDNMDLGQGLWVYDQEALTVKNLYHFAFGRQAEGVGLEYWTQALESGQSERDIATAMAASDEFQAHAGASTDSDFIDALYLSLGRPADTEGKTYWTHQLEEGSTRADLVLGFSTSDEAFAQTADFRAGDGIWAPS
jgi:serralysin